MAKKSTIVPSHKNPELIKPRDEVLAALNKRAEIGKEFLGVSIKTEADFNHLRKKTEAWQKFNVEYLNHCFDVGKIADDYNFKGAMNFYLHPSSIVQKTGSLTESIERQINEIESIVQRLSLYQEKLAQPVTTSQSAARGSNKVFIVHGHDHKLKHEVARFVEKLGMIAVILDEQVNAGMTVIEKFETHASEANYAIVLLTHDDMGFPKNSPENVQPRARQNAIAELGYFFKALGRKNVAILCDSQIEIPTDFIGVIYLSVSNNNAWELQLAKEMKAAGLDVDMNKL